MKTILLPFLLLLCCSFIYFSEDNTAELQEIAPDFFVEKSLAGTDKANKVHEVFKKLKTAKGDYRSRKPVLHLVESTDKGIAVAYPLSGIIKLEIKGLELCESFGENTDDALAILLAHELIHIYEKHSWENLFAWEYSHTSLKNAVNNVQKEDEIQADYLGGVLAYQAGYQVFEVMPKFLDKVYEMYKLKDENMTDYPGLEQRKLFAVESADKFKYFTSIFEMANLLAVKGKYDEALAYYDEVLLNFQSREMYNNIGYVSVQAALPHFSADENRFIYPLELDLISRMKGGKGGRKADLPYRERKLLDAIYYFENAIHLDPKYPIARLNEACAHTLLGIAQSANQELEWMDATVSARRAIHLSEGHVEWKSTLADGYVALGILSSLQEEKEQANQHFQRALNLEEGHFLANYNRNVDDPNVETPFSETGNYETIELIDGMEFQYINLGKEYLKFKSQLSESDSINLYRQDFANSYLMTHETIHFEEPQDTTYFDFQLTKDNYPGTTAKGISLQNGNYKLIIEKYGQPYKQTRLGNGSLLHYRYYDSALDEHGIQELIFQLGPNGKLLRWMIYAVSE